MKTMFSENHTQMAGGNIKQRINDRFISATSNPRLFNCHYTSTQVLKNRKLEGTYLYIKTVH